MTNAPFHLTRRHLLAGTGSLIASSLAGTSTGRTQASVSSPLLVLSQKPLALAAAGTEMQAASFSTLQTATRDTPFDLVVKNDLQQPAVLDFPGLNFPSADPLAAFTRIAPGASLTRKATFTSAGTQIYDVRLFGGDVPMPIGAVAVAAQNDPTVDLDRILLIEDFRQGPDGTLLAPGRSGATARTTFTVNRTLTDNIAVRTNQRLRLRVVNGCQRQPVAIKIEEHDATVIAIDGQPSEPFPARDGQLILGPGTRIDVIVDALKAPGSKTAILLHDGKSPRPIAHLVYGSETARSQPPGPVTALASTGLPDRLDLKSALRSEITLLANNDPDWMEPLAFEAKRPAPVFAVKRGRTVVLALTNKSAMPTTFRLHVHHFRLLDRLDDGWKPFWQDRLLFQPGETHRIAYQPQRTGGFLLEAMGAEWSAPKLIRWFKVE